MPGWRKNSANFGNRGVDFFEIFITPRPAKRSIRMRLRKWQLLTSGNRAIRARSPAGATQSMHGRIDAELLRSREHRNQVYLAAAYFQQAFVLKIPVGLEKYR